MQLYIVKLLGAGLLYQFPNLKSLQHKEYFLEGNGQFCKKSTNLIIFIWIIFQTTEAELISLNESQFVLSTSFDNFEIQRMLSPDIFFKYGQLMLYSEGLLAEA